MLTVHESNRVESLVDALAEVLAVPIGPPTVPEWIAVQSRGMETWLSMELSRRFGVWAACTFPFPRQLLERLFEAVLGSPADDEVPFTAEHLLWALMAALPRHLDRPGFEQLAAYLDDDLRGIKRLGLARRVASALDQYAVYRPEMVLAWHAGQIPERAGVRWQADLYRACVKVLAAVPMAVRARAFVRSLSEEPVAPDALPSRICLFGVSTLPPMYVQVLHAAATRLDVHLFLPAPSAEGGERNPLLSSMGGQAREFHQVLLDAAQGSTPHRSRFVVPHELGPTTLLVRLQHDVLFDRPPRPGREPMPASDDRSLQIHSCHGPMREIEVLHDQLRDLLERDPTLHPDDVIVMAPDVEAYAPYVEAVFGGAAEGSDTSIPFRISDRRSRATAPAIEAFLGALALVRGRVTAAEVLDLLAHDPVGRRHGIDVTDLETLERWVRESGVRWGIDAAHRATFDQPAHDQNTWRFGLDRLLLGYALDGETPFGGVLPYEPVSRQGAPLLGRFAAFCDTLFAQLAALRTPRPLARWARDLEILAELLIDGTGDGAWQQQLIRAALQDLAGRGQRVGFREALDLDVVRDVLAGQFDESRSAHGFLAGGVTVCNLLPMRSIPFRVVCMVGLSDGEFPRTQQSPRFDQIAHDPRPGDRSTRGDDRYLFLEALLSARDNLVLTYVGQSIRDNADLPPSVLVSELLDAACETLATHGESPAAVRDRLVVRHPLQPFSLRYFDGSDAGRLFSYREGYCEGARALAAERVPPVAFLHGPLPATEPRPTLTLDELGGFLRSPAGWFLRRSLGVWPREPREALPDREPITPSGLDDHRMATDLLRHDLGGGDPADYRAVLAGRGELPLGAPGRCHFDDLQQRVAPLARALRAARYGTAREPQLVDLAVGGCRLTGRLTDLRSGGLLLYTPGRPGPVAQLQLWLRHLILCCGPGSDMQHSDLLARGTATDVARVGFGPIQGDPRELLAALVQLFEEGQRQPLRFFPASSMAYAEAVCQDGEAPAMALRCAYGPWRARILGGGRRIPGEGDDDTIHRLFGTDDPLAGGDGEVHARFHELAIGVLQPLLDHRELEDL